MRSAISAMRSAISALAGFALAGSFVFAQPSDGRLKIIHETVTLRVAYRTDSRPFSYVDAQGRPIGYTIELCERIARSLEAQLNVALTIKWVPVDERTRFDAIVNGTADMECGSTTVSLSRMKIVDFSSVVFADSTGVLVKFGKELFTFDNMVGKNIGIVAGTTNARAVRDQLARHASSSCCSAGQRPRGRLPYAPSSRAACPASFTSRMHFPTSRRRVHAARRFARRSRSSAGSTAAIFASRNTGARYRPRVCGRLLRSSCARRRM